MIYALHGFLGRPDDWKFLEGYFHYYPINIFNYTETSLVEAARSFNRFAAKQKAPRILMGYSMGGRFALHALVEAPELWEKAIIISAQPGLKSERERAERVKADSVWAERFENEPWDDLMDSWNSQSVFSGSLNRFEKDYARADLARVIKDWSLGAQEDLSAEIEALNVPILWAVGEKDQKYVQIAKQMRFSHPDSRLWIAPKAGHRLPWDVADALKDAIFEFTDKY